MESGPKKLLERGFAVHQEGRLNDAIAIYSQLVREHPLIAEGWHLLGLALSQQGDSPPALDAFSRAISADASQAVFFSNYGVALKGAGRHVEALACFHAAVRLKPEFLDGHLNLLQALTDSGQPRLALREIARAIDQFPANLDLLLRAAQLAQSSGDLSAAIVWFERWLKSTDSPLNPVDFGSIQRRAGVLTSVAQLLVDQNRPDEAAKALEEAIAIAPKLAEAHFQLARARRAMDDITAAEQSIAQACQLHPEHVPWQLRKLVMCPVVFRSVAEIDSFRDRLNETLDRFLQSGRVFTRDQFFSPSITTSMAAQRGRRMARDSFISPPTI